MGAILALAAAAVAVVLFVVLREDGGAPEPAPPAAEQESSAPASNGVDGSTDSRESGEPSQEAGPGEEPDSDSRGPRVPTIVVRGGEPVGGARELTLSRGERIRFAVRSDTAQEIHLHGYDLVREVEAGGRVRVDLEANLEGVFEVELHPSHAVIAEITVHP